MCDMCEYVYFFLQIYIKLFYILHLYRIMDFGLRVLLHSGKIQPGNGSEHHDFFFKRIPGH